MQTSNLVELCIYPKNTEFMSKGEQPKLNFDPKIEQTIRRLSRQKERLKNNNDQGTNSSVYTYNLFCFVSYSTIILKLRLI